MSALTKKGWIGGPVYDGFFFFGGALISLVFGGLALIYPAWIIWFWWGWIVLLDGPHLVATWTRTMATTTNRARWRRLMLISLLWFLPGFAALGLSALLGQPDLFLLFLLGTTIWSIHHNIKQHYGILSIYQWHASLPRVLQRLDKWTLYMGMWGMFVAFVLHHPLNRKIMGVPSSLEMYAINSARALMCVMSLWFVVFVVSLFWRGYKGLGVRSGLFLLGPVLGSHAVMYGIIGAREPLFEGASNDEQYFLMVAVVMGVIHSLQYLGIVFAVNLRRHQRGEGVSWDRRPLLMYGVFVLGSLVYLMLNLGRGTSPGWALFEENTVMARAFLAFYWGLFFHHFYVDQFIWKVSQDASLRLDLNLIKE